MFCFEGGGVLEEFGGFRYRFYGFMRFMDWRVYGLGCGCVGFRISGLGFQGLDGGLGVRWFRG